jgi:hypothetical protein
VKNKSLKFIISVFVLLFISSCGPSSDAPLPTPEAPSLETGLPTSLPRDLSNAPEGDFQIRVYIWENGPTENKRVHFQGIASEDLYDYDLFLYRNIELTFVNNFKISYEDGTFFSPDLILFQDLENTFFEFQIFKNKFYLSTCTILEEIKNPVDFPKSNLIGGTIEKDFWISYLLDCNFGIDLGSSE